MDKSLTGYTNFIEFYLNIVNNSSDDSHFVEVNCRLGESTAFIADLIITSTKRIKLDAIDTWKNEHWMFDHFSYNKTNDSINLYDEFINNMKERKVLNVVTPKFDTSKTLKEYSDRSLDFVFLNNCYKYRKTIKEINSWMPKVKNGGILAGTNLNIEEVKHAINDVIGAGNNKLKVKKYDWLFFKNYKVNVEI